MKKILLIPLLLVTSLIYPQKYKVTGDSPATWTYTVERKVDKSFKTVYEVHMTCKLGPGWRIYSQMSPEASGVAPIPLGWYPVTDKKTAYLFGSVMEDNSNVKKFNDPHLGIELLYYEDRMDLFFNVKMPADSCVFSWQLKYQLGTGYQDLPVITDRFKAKLINTEGYNFSGAAVKEELRFIPSKVHS